MSFDINISKIKCSGKHGIYDHEKQNDQEFLVDIHINISDFSADNINKTLNYCLLYTSPSPRDGLLSRMPSSA